MIIIRDMSLLTRILVTLNLIIIQFIKKLDKALLVKYTKVEQIIMYKSLLKRLIYGK